MEDAKPYEPDYINATSICHRSNGNYQIDYSGSTNDCIARFEAWCLKSDVEWAKLFNAKTGKEIYSYQK